MKKIIIVSHGDMARGMKDTLEMITGNQENIFALSMKADENPDHISSRFEEIYSEDSSEDSYLIASDLPGGSVNTAMMQFLKQKNTYLVSGVNLVFLLEYLFSDELDTETAIENAISSAREALKHIKIETNQINEDDIWE
ncbi:PTS sugar transporter subunit IIA [Amphibacillus sp. Q70]|uniref:PTS sugar transporter subunit IIA n=1 Tax=Amphibacillus sp. Q70 TaxID=3453416 RepID=UPI003F839BAE